MPTNPTDVVNPGFTVNAITPIVLTLDPSRGENGEPGEPGQGINWRGEWATGIAYSAYDAVSRNGGSYLAEVNNNSVDPATDNGSVWGIISAPGATGPPGPTGLTNRGNWNATTQYNINDLVSRTGSSYLAIAPNINIDPSLGDATHWQMFASAGTGTGDMVKAVYDTNNDGIVDKAALATAVPWSGITGVPSVFPASPHAPTHNLGGSDQVSPDWTQIQSKPVTFPPSPHAPTHLGGSDPIAPASTTTAGLLAQISGLTTDYVRGDNTCQNLGIAIQPTIWSVRLRSFNAIGNPNFEVDQRQCGAALLNPGAGYSLDRWQIAKNGTLTVNTQQTSLGTAVGGGVLLPGTSFVISQSCLRITLTAQETSMAAGDYLIVQHYVEGNCWRELMGDVHSLQILVRSSVSGLRFGVALNDGGSTLRTLTKLSPAGLAAGVWTLVQFPNLPVWPSGGNFTSASGAQSYVLRIVLACGSSNMSPANDTWQNGNFLGAVGQSNFASSAVNSTFDIAFVQHEPGPVCSTLQDKMWFQNYSECLRYYQKTYDYATLPGTVTSVGCCILPSLAGQPPYGHFPFKKPMAKVPTVSAYSDNNGAWNTVYDAYVPGNRGVNSAINPGLSGFGGFATSSVNASPALYSFHYTSDTGW